MNICKCGCGKECKNNFVRGHNKRKVSVQPEEVVKIEEEFIPKESYTLTDVPKDVIINYEAGKKWLDKHYDNYSVMLLHNEKEEPYEIVLSAWEFLDEEHKKKVYVIGKGNTFSNALKEILINT